MQARESLAKSVRERSQRSLDPDILLYICHFLDSRKDKLAFAMLSRWHYTVLGDTPYHSLTLSPEMDFSALVRALRARPERRKQVHSLDIRYPAPKSLTNSASRRFALPPEPTNIIHGALSVLKLCTEVKRVRFRDLDWYRCYSVPVGPFLDVMTGMLRNPSQYRTRLDSLSFAFSSNELGVDFIRSQTSLQELVLLVQPCISKPGHDTRYDIQEVPDVEISPVALPELRRLWAAPWWAKLILPDSSVTSFGLMHDGSTPGLRRGWSEVVHQLIERGGHSTVRSLTLPYEDFFWDHRAVSLQQLGAAFPNTHRLSIVLPGIGAGRIEDTEACLKHVKDLVKQYESPLFPSVSELVFLRIGDFWPSPFGEPYEVKQIGQCCANELTVELAKLIPSLCHVDLGKHCLKKVQATGLWVQELRTCSYL